jgi:oxygen-independent coproporphyrinogen-3 oxidase
MELDVLREPAATEVGSYFVANYPPFSVWNRQDVPEALRALSGEYPVASSELGAPSDACQLAAPSSQLAAPPLGLYLHIPFCRKRCEFCYFRVYTDKNADEVDVYMDALAREVALYKDRPRLAGRQFEFVYFGGGTPSFLSSDQLKRLIDRINRHWRWDAAREVTFECEPGTLKKHKLETIRAIGTTRLSLGIEHFDDEILERNGRAHQSPEIYRAYDWAREIGFLQINIDLIAGMVGDTDDKWRRAVDEALRLAPDSVTIYQMELPHNTLISRAAREAGRPAPVASWAQKRAWVAQAFEQFERAGYTVSSGYTLVRPSPASGFVYRDSLWHGGEMVGMGVASFSHVAGVHYQNHDQWDDYVGALQRDELPLSRALRATPHQLLVRELILQLKLGRLDAGYFRDRFGVQIVTEFADAFASLVMDELAAIEDDRVTLTRAGLLQVDALLPRFFEPQHRDIRYT